MIVVVRDKGIEKGIELIVVDMVVTVTKSLRSRGNQSKNDLRLLLVIA